MKKQMLLKTISCYHFKKMYESYQIFLFIVFIPCHVKWKINGSFWHLTDNYR